ncbi:hypothetical protein Ancab_006721 [Ancistrocladus abbreviatus]
MQHARFPGIDVDFGHLLRRNRKFSDWRGKIGGKFERLWVFTRVLDESTRLRRVSGDNSGRRSYGDFGHHRQGYTTKFLSSLCIPSIALFDFNGGPVIGKLWFSSPLLLSRFTSEFCCRRDGTYTRGLRKV